MTAEERMRLLFGAGLLRGLASSDRPIEPGDRENFRQLSDDIATALAGAVVLRKRSDLPMADWLNMTAAERAQAIADLRLLAASHAVEHRRMRAINVVASYLEFLTEEWERRP